MLESWIFINSRDYLLIGARTEINVKSTIALLVEQGGVKDNVLVVDTTNGGVGVNAGAESGKHLNVANFVRFGPYGDIMGKSTNDSYIRISGGGTAGNGAAILMYGNSASSYPGTMRFYAGSGYRMLLTADGKLGINDYDPAEYLDVNGNINVTGVYKVDDVQVVRERYINSDFSVTIDEAYGLQELRMLKALRDCLIHHGLASAS